MESCLNAGHELGISGSSKDYKSRQSQSLEKVQSTYTDRKIEVGICDLRTRQELVLWVLSDLTDSAHHLPRF